MMKLVTNLLIKTKMIISRMDLTPKIIKVNKIKKITKNQDKIHNKKKNETTIKTILTLTNKLRLMLL